MKLIRAASLTTTLCCSLQAITLLQSTGWKKTDRPYPVKTEGNPEPTHAELKWDVSIATEQDEEHPVLDNLRCLALVSTGLCQYQDKQKGTNMNVKEGQKKNKG